MQRTAVSTKETPASANAMSWSPLLKRSARVLQRKCACGGMSGPSGECEECRKKLLQRKIRNPKSEIGNDSSMPAIVHEVLSSPGQPLDPATRAFMESRFGHDFSAVRIHRGLMANSAAEAVNAAAFTVGRDVVFAHSFYQPHTVSGRFLLAHELAHTIQQGVVSGADANAIGRTNDATEAQADAVAERVSLGSNLRGTATHGLTNTGLALARLDCSKLKYRDCRAGVYKCGFGNSGTCAWVGPTRGGCVCVGELGPKDLIIALAALAIIAAVIASLPADIIAGIGIALAAVARWLALLFGLGAGAGLATAAGTEKGDNEGEAASETSPSSTAPGPTTSAPTAQPPAHSTAPPTSATKPSPSESHPSPAHKESGHPPLKKGSGGHTYRLSVIEGLNLERVTVGKHYAIMHDPKGPKQKFVVLQVTNKVTKGSDTTVEFVSLLECSRTERQCDAGGNVYTVTHPYRPSEVRTETGRVLSEK